MMNRNIENIDWEKISRYLSREMNGQERSEFEEFIKSNPECAEIVKSSEKDLKLIDGFHNSIAKFDSNKGWEKVLNSIQESESTKMLGNLRLLSGWKTIARIAAVLFFALGLGYGSYVAYYNYLAPFKTIKTAYHETDNVVRFSDGSVVQLNGNSQVKYPRSFAKEERRVSLKGEAFFDIAKNPDKPFIISMNGAEVKVLGTSFNVKAKENNIEVFVKSGKVQLSSVDSPKEFLLLEKGDFGAILQNKKLTRMELKDENYLSWKTKQMIFRETNLKEVAKVINRTYRVQVQFNDPEIMNLRLTSTFDHEPLEIILESLSRTFNIEYEQDGSKIVFQKK